MKEEADFGWVAKGSQRRKLIKVMTKPKIPTQLKEDTKISRNNVTDVLRELVVGRRLC